MSRAVWWWGVAAGLALAPLAPAAGSPRYNGFDVSVALIDTNQIVRGGPPRDGIPALDHPKFIPVKEADFLEDGDLVIAVERGGVSRAYPLRIMLWHEIANDRLGQEAIVVTYCPLCGTSVVFDGNVAGQTLSFGVSGLLFQSDVLMYDRQTESLWSQLAFKAVTGPMAGTPLRWLPSQILTWAAWKKKHPGGEVLSTETGFARDYTYNPYAGYEQSPGVWFGVPNNRDDYAAKTWVLGLLVDGQAKAYALDELPPRRQVRDYLRGVDLELAYDPESRQPTVLNAQSGEPVPFTLSYWFAWQAFYPDTEIWRPVRLELNRALGLTVKGEPGKSYVIEASSNLATWNELERVTVAEDAASVEPAVEPAPRQFYRARLLP